MRSEKEFQEVTCGRMEAHLPDLLLDPQSVKPAVRQHFDGCAACRAEVAELRAAMGVLDTWTAPEPSPYFHTRLQAKLRAAKEAQPEGFWESLRSRFLFSTNLQMRTVGAAAFAVLLAIGGGSALYVVQQDSQPAQVQASATVRDLQALDGNEQVFQQLSALDDDGSTDAGSSN